VRWRVVFFAVGAALGIAAGRWMHQAPAVCPDGAELAWSKAGAGPDSEALEADLLGCRTADGIVTGPWVKWVDGTMTQAGYSSEGRLHGSAFSWSSDGRRDAAVQFEDGETGSFTDFDEEGHLVLDWKKLSNDAALTRAWYPSGQLKSRVEWRAGEPHGLSESWHSNGQPAARGSYTGGSKTGLWRCWNEDGSQVVERAFRNGELEPIAPANHEAWTWPCYRALASDGT